MANTFCKGCSGLLAAIISVGTVLLFSCAPSPERRPNVIVIITDDQGYGDIAAHGNPWIKTPNLDQLYSQSTRLTDFHVSPTCAPTRAALMTGHYANRTGVWHTVGGRSLLRESEVTMADIFQDNGYATAMFGKWHLGDNYPFRPQDRGFDEALIHGGGGVGQSPDYWNNDYFDDTYFRNGRPEAFSGYCTDVWFDNAIRFMEGQRHEEKPFFCYIATNAPHDPFHVADGFTDPYQGNDSINSPEFYGMIANLDQNVGNLLQWLHGEGLEENTVLVFMTDNGTSGGVRFAGDQHAPVKGFNAGMRGRKGSMYEGGHRVPFFMRWPAGGVTAGRDIDALTAHVDVLPTFIDMFGLETPEGLQFDGVSLKPLLLNESDSLPARTLITDSQRIERPVKWRQSSVMQDKWRLINGTELYNLKEDPSQRNDLAVSEEGKVRELRQAYEEWWSDISLVFDESPAIALCPPGDSVTVLSSHDMHMDEGADIVAWNQYQVRDGRKSNGWWVVKVPQAGVYRFSLMRWPPEANVDLLAGLPATEAPPSTSVKAFPEGKALPVTEAGISIGNYSNSSLLSESNGDAAFEAELTAGQYDLRGWFRDSGETPFGAYYIKVERADR